MNTTPKNSGKAPSFQFYYKDWLADQRVKRATPRQRADWIDLICWSVDMPTPGVFVDGKEAKMPLSETEIAKFLRGNLTQNIHSVRTLLALGLLKQDSQGIYYVQRVKKDLEIARKRAESGVLGAEYGRMGGNPAFQKGQSNPYYHNPKDNPLDNPLDNPKDNPPSARKMKMKKKKDRVVGKENKTEITPTDKGPPIPFDETAKKILKEQGMAALVEYGRQREKELGLCEN